MASFTYTVWSDLDLPLLIDQLKAAFEQLNFALENPRTGKIHFWKDGENQIDPNVLGSIKSMGLPLAIQWWREEDDIVVSIAEAGKIGGLMCDLTLVGLPREEQAEIAKLLLLHVTPDKQFFPDDFDVFRLSAQ